MPEPFDNQKLTRRGLHRLAASFASAYLLDPRPASAAPPPASPADLIHPLIGASINRKLGEGKTFPGAATPFGLVQLSPDTMTGGDCGPGYSYDHTTIEGFSFLHMTGVGWYGDLGNLQVMPTSGPLKIAAGRLDKPGEGWRSRFRHETEEARAGYYAVTLDDYGIRAELTAAPRAGLLRFTFPRAEESRIQIDLARRVGGTSTRQYVKVFGNSVSGWMRCTPEGGGWGNGRGKGDYTIFYRMEFSRSPERFGVWSIQTPPEAYHAGRLVTDYFRGPAFYEAVRNGQVLPGCSEYEGEHIGFYAEFGTRDQERVMVKAGVSLVSLEGARENLEHDLPGWNFEDTVAKARRAWDEELRKLAVEGGTPDERVILSTALYHSMIDPRAASDVDGKYTAGDKKVRIAKNYTRRTIFSGWDVFRAEFPLMTLLKPRVVSDTISSLVDLAEESGKGYLERWEFLNAYSGCMDGDPTISVITDAYCKGIRSFDVEKAYSAARQSACGVGPQTGRPHNDFYLQHGYVPKVVSWTLDNAYYDWCLGILAGKLGKADDARMFLARARNYRNIYDPAVESMHAKDENGEWIEWKGRTVFGQGCSESNPGQQMWFVPHDVQGLMNLVGEERFLALLEDLFEKTPPSFGWNDYYNHSNEPVHHIPYLFVYAGKPYLTQKWVRKILDGAYHNRVDGICGNDDVGQMSAWYAFGAIGLYPACPGDNTYIIGSPIFSRTTLRLDPDYYKGGTFTIVAQNSGPANWYIRAARLNGKPLSRAWVTHKEVTRGGVLELTMSQTPNPDWGAAAEDRPPSLSIGN